MLSTTRVGWSDFRVLWHLLAKRVRGTSHAERLDSFYAGQAWDYDSFRSKLLHGRQVMIDAIDAPQDGVWVDIGAGTGENAERLAHRRMRLKSLYLVDLCRPPAASGRGVHRPRRVEEHLIRVRGWDTVHSE